MLFLIVTFASQATLAKLAYLALCVPYALASLRGLRAANRPELELVCGAMIAPASLLAFSVARVGPSALYHAVVACTAVIVAYAATRDLETYLIASKWGLVLSHGVVLAYLASVGIGGFPLDNMIPDRSSNGITSYLVVLQLNYCVVRFLLHGKIAWATQLVTLFICFVGFGRGSILASASILVASLATSTLPSAGRWRIARLAAIGVVAGALLSQSGNIRLFAEANTKLGSGLQDQSRQKMMSDYLGALSPATIVLGGSYDRTTIATDFNFNPHNSFIRAHHIFGGAYLAAIILLPAFLFLRSRATLTGRAYLLFAVLILYIRVFTEPVLFPTPFDFFVFGMCFTGLGVADAMPSAPRALARPQLVEAS